MERSLPVNFRGRTQEELKLRRPEIQRKNAEAEPTVFHLKAPLPSAGQDRLFVAATDRMLVNLMTHAVGATGEIELHSHPNEDHVFVVLQGAARFGNAAGEEFDLHQHEGVLLPRKTIYRFEVIGDVPLILLRMGCWIDPEKEDNLRMDDRNRPFKRAEQANTVPTEYIPNAYFE